jgi:hypothetical protein
MNQRPSLIVFALAVLATGVSHAQTAPPPANPLDVVPDKMPFDAPYGAPVTLDHADVVLAASLAEANKHGGSRSAPSSIRVAIWFHSSGWTVRSWRPSTSPHTRLAPR